MTDDYFREKFVNFQVHKRRWLMLFYFSFCCMTDNIICFTFAPINKICYQLYGHSNNIFPQVYLIVYSIFSIPISFLLSDFSIRTNVVSSAALQFVGCLIRYLYWENVAIVMFGQFLSSIGQIVFVNAPPEVSLMWFPANERIISTSISIISNVLGTAVIYAFAPFIVLSKDDIRTLLLAVCLLSFVGAFLTFFFFENAPECNSIQVRNNQWCQIAGKENIGKNDTLEKGKEDDLVDPCNNKKKKIFEQRKDDTYYNEDEEDTECDVKKDYEKSVEKKGKVREEKFDWKTRWKEMKRFMSELKVEVGHILSKRDIIKIIIVFCYSECLISSFSADMSTVLKEKSINKTYFASAAFLFIINTIVGSAILCFSASVAIFKKLILLCISMIILICFTLNFATNDLFTIFLLGAIGFWCGPIQPLSVEMAAVNVYPLSSNLCTSVMQVVAFTASAIFISLFSYVSKYFNANNPIMCVSLVILLIGFYLTPVMKGPAHSLAFSIRSGMLKRDTIHVAKCGEPYMDNYLENHSEHWLEIDTDICLMHSDSQLIGRVHDSRDLLQLYHRLSSLPHHSSFMSSTSNVSDSCLDGSTRQTDENKRAEGSKEKGNSRRQGGIYGNLYKDQKNKKKREEESTNNSKGKKEENEEEEEEEEELSMFRIDEIEKYRGEYLSAFRWGNKENFEKLKEQLLMCEGKRRFSGMSERRGSEFYTADDDYKIDGGILLTPVNSFNYNTT